MRKIKIDIINGIKEIAEFDYEDSPVEFMQEMDIDYLLFWLANFNAQFGMQWQVTEEQFQVISEQYTIGGML